MVSTLGYPHFTIATYAGILAWKAILVLRGINEPGPNLATDWVYEPEQIPDKVHTKLLRLKIDEGFENRQAGVLGFHHTCKLLIRKGSLMEVRWFTMVY